MNESSTNLYQFLANVRADTQRYHYTETEYIIEHINIFGYECYTTENTYQNDIYYTT